MCGIAGFIDHQRRSSEQILQRMSTVLAHRGPDGDGLSFDETPQYQVGLGHRRLSIIDLSDLGKQPMRFQQLQIIYNGEIYNFREVRQELEKEGDSFLSNSDTEVILHAYKKWGPACLQRFTGMFAFVIYDAEKQQLFCARDRVGVKPFFYYQKDGLFLFASELKAFHEHPGFIKEMNPQAVAAFMQFGNVPTPWCIFKNALKLPPAHYLRLNLQTRTQELVRYWNVYDYYNQPKLNIGFSEAREETERLLTSAAEYRMVSDVPVGIFLSGGFDSACLTALLQKNRSEKLKTFTIGVPDIGLDEAPYARQIAAHLGTEHQEFYCTEKEALELIPSLSYFYDEPFGDQSAVPTSLVSRMARKEVKVALSADAGDEVFAGYNRYGYIMKQGRLLQQLPAFLRRGAASVLRTIPPDKLYFLRKKYNFHYRYEKLKLVLEDPSTQNIMHRLSKQFLDEELALLMTHPLQPLDTAFLSKELKQEFYSPLSYMMAIDYQTYLVDDILQKVDRASMSQHLEAREPYLDHRLIEWAARLPDDYKYHQHIKKYIIRQIVYKYIPKELMDRPKMGFAVPIENWLGLHLKEQVRHYLSEERIRKQGLFNPAFISELTASFYSGRKELALKIWYLYMFQLWHERWME